MNAICPAEYRIYMYVWIEAFTEDSYGAFTDEYANVTLRNIRYFNTFIKVLAPYMSVSWFSGSEIIPWYSSSALHSLGNP